jgi:hypothetical protein
VAERLVVVAHVGVGPRLLGVLEAELARADGHAVAVLEFVLVELLAADEDVVGAAAAVNAAVDDDELPVLETDVRVVARGARVVEHHGVVGRAADGAQALRRELALPLAAAGVNDVQKSHEKNPSNWNGDTPRRILHAKLGG